ncbi:hypothetical protein BH09GEM1_BH09GEM1_14290 [soil metagenome]
MTGCILNRYVTWKTGRDQCNPNSFAWTRDYVVTPTSTIRRSR